MARNPFTTGFSAGLGVLFAILLFPFILIGGCLLTVGSCGAAAVKSLPKANVSASAPSPERPTPVVESNTSVDGPEAMPALKSPKYSSAFKHEIVNFDARGSLRRMTVFVEKPTKADIAQHIQTIRDLNKTATHIYIDYYDDRRAAVVSSKGRDTPEWIDPFLVAVYGFNQTTGYNSLAFRHEKSIPDLPKGGPIEGEAGKLLQISKNLASIEQDEKFSETAKIKHLVVDGRELTSAEIDRLNNAFSTNEELEEIKKEWNKGGSESTTTKNQKQAEAARDTNYRTWTSADGKFTTEAKLLSYANGTITIETSEKKKKSVPLKKLSKADQDFVAKWRRQH
jgi:hypothetical protein